MPELRSPLSPDECSRRLVARAGEAQLYRGEVLPHDTRMLARVSGRRFQLWRYAGLRNAFGYRFHGHLVPVNGATAIRGTVRLGLSAILLLALLPAWVIGLSSRSPQLRSIELVELRVALLWGIGVVLIGTVQAIAAHRFADPFLAFLRNTLEATVTHR